MNRLQYLVTSVLIVVTFAITSGCGNANSETKSNGSKSDNSTSSTKGDSSATTEKNEDSKGDNKKTDESKGKKDEKKVATKAKSSKSNPKFITFDDLLINIPPETQYRPVMMKEDVQALDGEYVSIPGEFLPGTDRLKGIKEFVLGRNAKCKFGPDGQADHVIRVFMADGASTKYTDQRVEVAGRLKIVVYNGPAGYTWSIYEMHADKVSKHRKSQRR